MTPPLERLEDFLVVQKQALGLTAAAVLNFGAPEFLTALKGLQTQYSPSNLKGWPDYLRNSAEMRRDPRRLFPWAKAAVFMAVPCRHLPAKTGFLPLTDDPNSYGLVAGYAGRLDYHLYGRQVLAKFAENLVTAFGPGFRSEPCLDTRPLAEKSLAIAAGLGRPGKNTCLRCGEEGSGCFIATLLVELDLPSLGEPGIPDACATCDRCRRACPNGVLQEAPKDFACPACRSYLTMETGGELNEEQRRRLGEWLFACDLCTAACPESKLPAPLKVDLEWLLAAPTARVRTAIKATPLEYAGVTRLRRNALYVLANKAVAPNRKILNTVATGTKSDFLRKLAGKLLNQ